MKLPNPSRFLRRSKPKTSDSQDTPGDSRITNRTMADNREEILGKARKYIYPLQHSKHRIVMVSITLFIIMIVSFFGYVTLALYKFQNNSTFIYRVSQVIPFPVARTGSNFVSYESYLFELRHYVHYYENQQELDFDTDAGQQQLEGYKRRALNKVIDDAYIKQLAEEKNITVSNQELEDQLIVMRSQNRLGDSDKVFEDVLRDFWDWSVEDFKRSLRQQMLAQKVVASMDVETWQRAEKALKLLKEGADFADVAREYSEDPSTKENGGEFSFLVDRSSPDLTPETTRTLFNLQPTQFSDILNIGYALEIVKNIEKSGDKIRGAHILFNFQDVGTYINDKKEQQPARTYIALPEPPQAEEGIQPTDSPIEQ